MQLSLFPNYPIYMPTAIAVLEEGIVKYEVHYPESDGEPMAENTLHFRVLTKIESGLQKIYKACEDIFVAGDLLYYPVEGNPYIRLAPDVLVVLGRHKGDRGSYIKHKEGGIAPHIVFEVVSPSNNFKDMLKRYNFYSKYGIQEYYNYHPKKGILTCMYRTEGVLAGQLEFSKRYKSPLMQIEMEVVDGQLQIYDRDGNPTLDYMALDEALQTSQKNLAIEKKEKEQERKAKEQERKEKETALKNLEEEKAAKERLLLELNELKALFAQKDMG